MELIDVDAFAALVADALATIPDELRVEMENVAIIIDDESPPGSLYGLYEGIPLTSRGRYTGRVLIGSRSSSPRSVSPPARPWTWPARCASRCSTRLDTTSASVRRVFENWAGPESPRSSKRT
jgi:hypothetical protein